MTADGTVQILGVKLIGVTASNGRKLLLTLCFIAGIYLLSRVLRVLSGVFFKYGSRNQKIDFWIRQAISLAMAIIILVGLVSIWFDNPQRLGTAFGFVTAGLAFALQKVVTAVAAYFVILRGKTFNVGDRIRMASVRGDVIALGFIQTTIMEMGEPPSEQGDPPAMWVRSRQYTGRIVTITNDKIFDEPVYNYSREFPYIWEEMNVPISYKDNRTRAEQIILEVAEKHTVKTAEMSEDVIREMEKRYFMRRTDMRPRVFWRLTDNWIEMSVRFITKTYGIRELKDAMSRDIIDELDKAGIGIASGTYEVVGFPPVKVQLAGLDLNGNQQLTAPQEHTNTHN
jgi:small-conductance mechanosensitive channel